MEDLSAVLDAFAAVAAEDLKPMFGAQLLDRLRQALVLQNQVAAEVTRLVRECELTGAAELDGLKTMPSWLRGHGHLSTAEAGRLVRSGRALEHLPTVAAAFAGGAVTAAQVGVIAAAVTEANAARADAQGVDLAGFDRVWAQIAAEAPFDALGPAVAVYQAALDPDGPEPDPTEGRRLTLARHADGSLTGRFDLDPVGGEKLQAAIESIVQADRPAGDLRTRAQQQADALVQLADNALAAGTLPFLRTVKPHLLLTIGIEDLMNSATGPGAARTGFGATLSAAKARWLACDASITRIVLDADGQPLDVGRSKRVVPAHLRRAVELRDRHCVFTGCTAPSHWCEVHHLVEWINGGETSLTNSALVCERHHTKVHHGFRIERDPGGRWHTYRPDGTEILIGPPLRV